MPPHGKFQWPPRPLPEQDLGPPSTPTYWKPQPRSEPPPPPSAPPSPPRLPTPSPLQPSPLRYIETTFLGLTRPTFADRAADANWQPDNLNDLCPRCALPAPQHERQSTGCKACRDFKLPWDRAVRLARYHALLRQAIHEIKFSAWRRLGQDLGRLLGHQLQPLLAHVPKDKLVLVPVPCTLWRRLSRGIDHTLTITRGIHQLTGGTIAPALSRKHSKPQVGLSGTARRRNVAGSMKLKGHPRFEGCTILVIDDVRTTGATMAEACKALRKGLKERGQTQASIWSVTLGTVEQATDHDQPN